MKNTQLPRSERKFRTISSTHGVVILSPHPWTIIVIFPSETQSCLVKLLSNDEAIPLGFLKALSLMNKPNWSNDNLQTRKNRECYRVFVKLWSFHAESDMANKS